MSHIYITPQKSAILGKYLWPLSCCHESQLKNGHS